MDQLRRYPAASVVIDAAVDWLKERSGQPFFLWVHLMDPHHPYYPPQNALESLGISHIMPKRVRFLNSFWNREDVSPGRLQRYKKETMTLYDAGVHFVDHQLSRLVDALKAHRCWTETVFVVTADHGEEFLEHGNRYHSPTDLAQELIHVPLLVRPPGISSPAIVPVPFSLIHLAPTLLEALEIDVPASFTGRCLWKEICAGNGANLPAIVECVEWCNNQLSVADRLGSRLMAILDGQYKLILRFREASDHLYNLKDDPAELRPLPGTVQVKERVRLLHAAREHLHDARALRDTTLSLRARFREIRQRIDSRSSPLEPSHHQSAVEIGKHG